MEDYFCSFLLKKPARGEGEILGTFKTATLTCLSIVDESDIVILGELGKACFVFVPERLLLFLCIYNWLRPFPGHNGQLFRGNFAEKAQFTNRVEL